MNTKRTKLDNVMGWAKAATLSDTQEPDAPVSQPIPAQVPPMPDGRSLRATGRTHQFSTRVKIETHDAMKWLALHERITLGELLEKMVETYQRDRAKG